MRALRLYERLGLIQPARSASGWRLYGRRELVRLNAIVALKSLGLGLAHIAEVLSSSTPALRRVLRLQQEVLQKRCASADQGLKLVGTAGTARRAREAAGIRCRSELPRSAESGEHVELDPAGREAWDYLLATSAAARS